MYPSFDIFLRFVFLFIAVICFSLSNIMRANAQDLHEFSNTMERLAIVEHDAAAQYLMGKKFLLGHSVSQDKLEAQKWFSLSAEQGYPKAQYQLAKMYLQGDGIPVSGTLAVKYLRMAADKKHIPSVFELANCYLNGIGVPADVRQAIDLYRLAAADEHTGAIVALGKIYFKGIGVERDLNKAKDLLQQAAQVDDPNAIALLKEFDQTNSDTTVEQALALLNGSQEADSNSDGGAVGANSDAVNKSTGALEVGSDSIENKYRVAYKLLEQNQNAENNAIAIKLLEQAANHGYVAAQLKLAKLYHQGIKVAPDLRQSADWYEKAAINGDAEAQFIIGTIYKEGRGKPQNDELAQKWYGSAADQGHEGAQNKLSDCQVC